MSRHVKVVVFLAAIALIAVLILNMKKETPYGKVPEVEKLLAKEVFGIKLVDAFLGVLGLAFVCTTTTYIASLVRGRGKQQALAAVPVPGGEVVPAEAPPRKKLALEKVLGRTGTKILSVVAIIFIILIVLTIVILLFASDLANKFPFLQKLLEALG
jgi:hypothetical protein